MEAQVGGQGPGRTSFQRARCPTPGVGGGHQPLPARAHPPRGIHTSHTAARTLQHGVRPWPAGDTPGSTMPWRTAPRPAPLNARSCTHACTRAHTHERVPL